MKFPVSNVFWYNNFPVALPLKSGLPVKADIIIIGGGISGLSLLYYLLINHPTLNVFLLEQNDIGFGYSGRHHGILGNFQFPKPEYVVQNLQYMDELISFDEFEVDENKGGNLWLASQPVFTTSKLWSDINIFPYEVFSAKEIGNLIPSKNFTGGVYTPLGRNLNPFKLLLFLAATCEDYCFTNAPVTNITLNHKGLDVYISNRGVINTNYVVYCNNTSSIKGVNLTPFREEYLVTESLSQKAIGEVQNINLFYGDIYCRLLEDRFLIGGFRDYSCIEDSRTNMTNRLLEVLNYIFPSFKVKAEYVWSSIGHQTSDGIPLIGRVSDREFISSSYNGYDWDLAWWAAKFLAKQITEGVPNLEFCDPWRLM